MAAVHDLPTEILCAIFELSTFGSTTFVPAQTSHIESQLPAQHRSAGSASASTAGGGALSPAKSVICALPSQKETLFHYITVSQVCNRWRDVAIGLHTLWTRMYLCLNAFISKDYTDTKATETTSMFLSRSGNLPLYLDISFTLDDPFLALSWIQKSRYEDNIRRVLLPHIGRCHSLRLISSDFVITAVLDVFLERNLSSSPNDIGYAPLSHLHLAKIAPASRRSSPDIPLHHGQPIFPPDLSIVAPHLTSLYVDDVQIAVFPRWSLENLSLNQTFISYQNHFHVFMKTRITTLVLHRVTIPGGLPYVRRLTTHHASPVRSLSLSELRCGGPEAECEEMYTLFFALSLYRTLKELELSRLSREAMSGLSLMLSASPALVFVDMQKLTLRHVKIETPITATITNAFPALNEVVLDCVDGGSELVYNIWKGNPAIWPQLTEIYIDNEMVVKN